MIKVIIYTLLLSFFTLFGEVNKGKPVYIIHEKDLFPEGITYSYSTNSLYIGSIKKNKIIQIDMRSGKINDFVPPKIINMGVLGLIVDDHNKLLWACANINRNGKRRSAIFKFDLFSGKLLKKFNNKETAAATFNDLAIDREGNVYFTNTDGNQVFRINMSDDSMSVFFASDQIINPNGITISPDNKYLYIASQPRGIRILDVKNKKIINDLSLSINTLGIDGLKYYKHSLIGIQNGLEGDNPIKINRYTLSPDNKRIIATGTIDENNPEFDIPTTFAAVGDRIYCIADSQLGNLNDQNYEIINPKLLKDIIIISYKL